ncbi:hypothetical protein ASD93_14855 [Microbacterium sp. Root180]|nr:hypothetical protein ASD93_14855 [Microbacterium sp. Root180]
MSPRVARARGEHAAGDDARLPQHRGVDLVHGAPDQLSGERGPGGVGVATRRRQTRKTGRLARGDERPDLGRSRSEHEGQVRPVVRHQRGRESRRHDPMRDDDDGSGIRRSSRRIERMGACDLAARGGQRARDDVELVGRDLAGSLQHHAGHGPAGADQGGVDELEEGLCGARGGAR